MASRIIGTDALDKVLSQLSSIEMLYTRGKGGQKVPILLSPDVIPTLLRTADEYEQNELGIDSDLLFANSGRTCRNLVKPGSTAI